MSDDKISRAEFDAHMDALKKSHDDHSLFMRESMSELKTSLAPIAEIQAKQAIKIEKNSNNIKWMGRIFSSLQAACLAIFSYFYK